MTITLTKTKTALAVVVLALLIPATAYAANNFTDVPAGKFYAEPVDWAFNNNITTGKTPTSFAPEDNVTRGETVTFLKRYNDNIVEPGFDAAQGEADANAAAIAAAEDDIATEAAALDDHAAHLTSHFVMVSPDGALAGSSYPGVVSTRIEAGAYLLDFPGLELITVDPENEAHCGLQSTPFADGTRITGIIPAFPPTSSSVTVWSRDLAGVLTDGYISVTVTC